MMGVDDRDGDGAPELGGLLSRTLTYTRPLGLRWVEGRRRKPRELAAVSLTET